MVVSPLSRSWCEWLEAFAEVSKEFVDDLGKVLWTLSSS
jgi:hypothetical protein